MAAGEVVGVFVMLQEEGLEVCHTVILAKQTPYFFSVGFIAVVPLVTLELCKFIYERPVYDELLVASARGVLYSCVPIRSMRKLVISKWGFPSRAGILFFDAAICARNDPLLFPTNMSGRSWSHTFWIRSRACCGWGGRSGANTVALPSKYSFRAMAGAHAPDAKKPCRKRILRTII